MKLTKRNNIIDYVELEHYDHLVKICEQVKASPADKQSAERLVWLTFDACRRLEKMDKAPEQLLIDDRVCPWSKVRENYRLAADAYEELLEALRSL